MYLSGRSLLPTMRPQRPIELLMMDARDDSQKEGRLPVIILPKQELPSTSRSFGSNYSQSGSALLALVNGPRRLIGRIRHRARVSDESFYI